MDDPKTNNVRTPILQGVNKGPNDQLENTEHLHLDKNICRRARIASLLVPVFTQSAVAVLQSLLVQYLVSRIAHDKGFQNSTDVDPCASDTSNKSSSEIADHIQKEASQWITNCGMCQSIPALFACLFVGSYCDIFGRRPILLVAIFTGFLKQVLILCVIQFHLDLHLLYLAYGLDGIVGSWFAILISLFSVTADITVEKESRIFGIFILLMLQTVMQSVASILVGFFIKYVSFSGASLLLCSFLAIGFFIPYIFLPETGRSHQGEVTHNPLTHLKNIFGFYIFYGTIRKRATCIVCLLLFCFTVVTYLNLNAIDSLYLLHKPFCWHSDQIGYYTALRDGGGSIIGVITFPIWRLCLPDEVIGMFASVFLAASSIFEAFIKTSWMFYLVPIPFGLSSGIIPVIRGMISIQAGPRQQGAVFSSIAVVETVCNLISASVFPQIYGATVSTMTGLVYLVMASFSLTATILFGVYFCIRPAAENNEVTIVVPSKTQESLKTKYSTQTK